MTTLLRTTLLIIFTLFFCSVFARRVCVIGGGIGGLSAATELEKRGYKVTVLEKEPEVGGKIKSYRIGTRFFESGAVFFGLSAQDLALKYGIPTVSFPISGPNAQPIKVFDPESAPTFNFDQSSIFADQNDAKRKALLRWIPLIYQYQRELSNNTLVGVPDVLKNNIRSFFQLSTENAVLLPQFILSIYGFGYGFLSDFPAFQSLKLNPTGSAYIDNYFKASPIGYQSVPRALASDLEDVQTNVTILPFARARGNAFTRIFYQKNGATNVAICSHVISAFPPVLSDVNKVFTDVSPLEQQYFSKIKTSNYYVSFVSGSGLPTLIGVSIPTTPGVPVKEPTSNGRPILIQRVYPDIDMVVVYSTAPFSPVADEVIKANVVADLQSLALRLNGQTVTPQIVRFFAWKYFPRVTQEDFLANYFDGFDREIQGLKKTFYVGAFLNFETVDGAFYHARQLISERFPYVCKNPAF